MSAAEMLAGAAPERTPDWHSIDWKKVWHTVRRLQARIVKAVAEGRWNKVQGPGLSAHALVQWPGSGHSASRQ